MLKVFYGEDRKKAQQAVERILGNDYEVVEADTLERGDMDSVFRGVSLFGDSRRILVKNLSENKGCWAVLADYADTPHNVVVWNVGLDKRSATYKALAKIRGVEFKEFPLAEDPNKKLVFDILDIAMRGDKAGALSACDKVRPTAEPYSFLGLMGTMACKKLGQNRKAAEAVKILAKADMDIKLSNVAEPWDAIKIALVKIAAL